MDQHHVVSRDLSDRGREEPIIMAHMPSPQSTAQVVSLDPTNPAHLPQLGELINAHLGLLVPGWALTGDCIASHLQRHPGQAITDPWVSERTTLCALEGPRLVAAAHLLRYGVDPAVGPSYAGTGEIAWFLAWADAGAAAAMLLAAAHTRMHTWGVTQDGVWNTGLPVGPFVGVPDVWPHIALALTTAGYQPSPDDEVVLGGTLDAVAPVGDPSLPGLVVERRLTTGLWAGNELRFAALLEGKEVGRCEIALDLSDGGALPALRQWAQLTELQVAEPWRNRGIGSWLVAHAVAWARLGGRSRLLVAAMADNAGAIRFYQRHGWEQLIYERKGWTRSAPVPLAGLTGPVPASVS
jgi:GNAT superfamily N-acetyltransferase